MKALRFLFAFGLLFSRIAHAETVSIVIPSNPAPRVEFGAEKLVAALKAVKLQAAVVRSAPSSGQRICRSSPRSSGAARPAPLR